MTWFSAINLIDWLVE